MLTCPVQGYNTGVVLYQLARMRGSLEYNGELAAARVAALALRHRGLPALPWNLAEQDWFTLLAWDRPHLFLTLPCRSFSTAATSSALSSSSILSTSSTSVQFLLLLLLRRYNKFLPPEFTSFRSGFRTKLFDVVCREEAAILHT